MKRIGLLIVCLVSALLLSAAVTVYADGEAEVKAFTVTDSEGAVVTEGDTDTELRSAFLALNDGDTVTINKDIETTSRLYTYASEDEPKTVNLDLAGNMIYCFEKIGTAMVCAGKYTTVNVYSSEEVTELTLRFSFVSPERTLTKQELLPSIDSVIEALAPLGLTKKD